MTVKRVLVTGAGGAPALNFIRSLQSAPERFWMAGTDSNQFYVLRSPLAPTYLVPETTDRDYISIIAYLAERHDIDCIHAQPDAEVFALSKHRQKLPARVFLPKHRTIAICQSKWLSFQRWERAGLRVPQTTLIRTPHDLRRAFARFGGKVWVRETSGAWGKGSFPAETYQQAKHWIDFRQGWGRFTAASYLSPHSVTWQSLWKDGELVAAQGRKRLYWEFANRAPSGITGITGAGVTVSDPTLDGIAKGAIYAIDKQPHGIFGVDLTYDAEGVPNPTEINIGRFFTTHYFFTKAGLNLPYLYIKLACDEPIPKVEPRINPLPPGLCWIRGMDTEPVLVPLTKVKETAKQLEQLRQRVTPAVISP